MWRMAGKGKTRVQQMQAIERNHEAYNKDILLMDQTLRQDSQMDKDDTLLSEDHPQPTHGLGELEWRQRSPKRS